jgi:hypothetical protein
VSDYAALASVVALAVTSLAQSGDVLLADGVATGAIGEATSAIGEATCAIGDAACGSGDATRAARAVLYAVGTTARPLVTSRRSA